MAGRVCRLAQDDDEDEDAAPEAAPSGPAAPMASNAEDADRSHSAHACGKHKVSMCSRLACYSWQEIELNVEDIDEAPIAPEASPRQLAAQHSVLRTCCRSSEADSPACVRVCRRAVQLLGVAVSTLAAFE